MSLTKVPFVDLQRIHQPIIGEIEAAIKSVITDSSFIGGSHVAAFEEAFTAYLGAAYCVGCANGTDAIELALEALGIGAGDEVIVPVHSWISTASAVARVGATAVFADTQADTFCIDPAAIEVKITPKTKAILPVHLYGHPCDMDSIMAIAAKHKLLVVEDCAQAHGATYKGKKVGTFGDAACFSFYPSKNLGALGDGGCVVTPHKQVADVIREINNCGQRSKNNIVRIARNSRLDGLQAAVLSVKLKYLDQWNDSRRQAASLLHDGLKGIADITIPIEETDAKHVYHLYVIKATNKGNTIAKLTRHNIDHGCHYPFLMHTPFKQNGSYPNAEVYIEQIVSLPLFAGITNAEINQIIAALK